MKALLADRIHFVRKLIDDNKYGFLDLLEDNDIWELYYKVWFQLTLARNSFVAEISLIL